MGITVPHLMLSLVLPWVWAWVPTGAHLGSPESSFWVPRELSCGRIGAHFFVVGRARGAGGALEHGEHDTLSLTYSICTTSCQYLTVSISHY